MRILLSFIFTALAIFAPGISLFAIDHALNDRIAPQKIYAIDILAQKKPLKFYIEECNKEEADLIASSYQRWFINIINLLKEQENKDIDNYKEIINFGADKKAYICTADPNEADIKFYFVYKNEYEKFYGPRGSAGVFKFKDGKMLIALNKNNLNIMGNKVLTHEIGHSLRMFDLYDGQFYDISGDYGSGVQWSIMHHSKALTCDDADAILNALYLTKKLTQDSPKDLEFKSFCHWKTDYIYKNARLLNRKPLFINYQGTRTVYDYCKDGTPHHITKINPSNYNNLYKELQAPSNCDYTPLPETTFSANINKNYTVADFKTGKILSAGKVLSPIEKNILMALPNSGGLVLQVSTDGKVPGYIKITDETGTVIYAMAYLQEGYNFIYDAYISGRAMFNPAIFVYDRKDPSKTYLYYPKGKEGNNCTADMQECAEMESLLNKTLSLVKGNSKIILPPFGGWGGYSYKKHIDNARTWEKYLLKNYPPISVVKERLNNEISTHLQMQKKNQIKLKMPIK